MSTSDDFSKYQIDYGKLVHLIPILMHQMYISITLSHFSNAQVEKAGNPPKIRKL
jgi:hypothetical protein